MTERNSSYLWCSNQWNHYLRQNFDSLIAHWDSSLKDCTSLHFRELRVRDPEPTCSETIRNHLKKVGNGNGIVISYLQPRKPSIGLTSESFSILENTSSSLIPVSAVSPLTISSRSPSGRNSWSGGSNSLMVTGRPESVQQSKHQLHIWNYL